MHEFAHGNLGLQTAKHVAVAVVKTVGLGAHELLQAVFGLLNLPVDGVVVAIVRLVVGTNCGLCSASFCGAAVGAGEHLDQGCRRSLAALAPVQCQIGCRARVMGFGCSGKIAGFGWVLGDKRGLGEQGGGEVEVLKLFSAAQLWDDNSQLACVNVVGGLFAAVLDNLARKGQPGKRAAAEVGGRSKLGSSRTGPAPAPPSCVD